MEDLFRFLMIRPPEAVEKEAAIPLEQPTGFQAALRDASASDSPRKAVKEAANRFIQAGDNYIDSHKSLNLGRQMLDLREQIETQDVNSLDMLQDAIKTVFQKPAETIVKSSEFVEDNCKLADSIIAIKLTPSEHHKPLAKLVKVLQTMALIGRVAAVDASLDEAGGVSRALSATLLLPEMLWPDQLGQPTPVKRPPSPEKPEKLVRLEEAQNRAKTISNAIDELMCIRPKNLRILSHVSDVGLDDSPRQTESNTPPTRDNVVFNLVLTPDAAARLSEETRAILRTEDLVATEQPLEDVVAILETSLTAATHTISDLEPMGSTRIIAFVGNTPITTTVSGAMVAEVRPPWDVREVYEPGIPYTCGNVQPVGVGELLIVKQQLVRYQGGDLAHIENVLEGETKTREHRRARKTEEFFEFEIETATEEERDLQSTERFEIQKEAEETIKRETKFEAGLTISASYGPIEVEANTNYALEKSKERSTKLASEFSKEIVSKSVSKFSETVREKRTMRIIEEVEEKNLHELANLAGNEHVVGVYQWIDKVYEAQVFNYGLRTMYDFMVPEPGAFLNEALTQNLDEDAGLKMPRSFTKKPSHLHSWNYQRYATRYQATGVEPPPKAFIHVSHTFHGGAEAEDSSTSGTYSEAAEISIETGYEAVGATIIMNCAPKRDTDSFAAMSVSLGPVSKGKQFYIATGGLAAENFSESIEFETSVIDSISATALVAEVVGYSVSILIECRRTDRELAVWKQTTHDTIMQAYLKQKADYEEKLAALAMQEGVEITGRNPAANRKLEKNELKKACISLMTRQHFDLFGSIEEGSLWLPQMDLAEAEIEGPYIRFFEQAFEWENMTYVFSPYFWGRKEKWVERLKYQDVDPQFVDFITAGAARVIVPARPRFEAAIEHFMKTGDVWQGGELPEIDDDLYLPIIEEMKEHLGAPGDEEPRGKPWLVTVPTTLVRLRPDGTLPQWVKDENGNWIPEEIAGDDS
jgi:hypothetical protein